MLQRTAYTACPLCDSPGMETCREIDCTGHSLYIPELPPLMKWLRCLTCGHVFTDGYWPPDALAEIFKKTHESQILCANMDKGRVASSIIIDRVASHAGYGGRWLDVGFGSGALLFTAQEYGFDPVGLELRPGAAEEMAAIGIPAYAADICSVRADATCRVVSMADVLEHHPFPKSALNAARSLLADNGVLFVSMPNMGSAIWQYSDKRGDNPYWVEIEHYHNFTRERLYALLAETGFTPLSYGVSRRYMMCMEVIARRT